MTEQEQRIAIAEACGWRKTSDGEQWALPRPHPDYGFVIQDLPPDYLHDLNAMHEAENQMESELRNSYLDTLWNLAANPVEGGCTWYLVHTDAAQRAEAFLRTKGLWK